VSERTKDFPAITEALARWWKSQNIPPPDAAFIMVRLAGLITGGLLAGDKKHLDDGLVILVRELHRAAHAALKEVGDGED